jgi:hypothetical protein
MRSNAAGLAAAQAASSAAAALALTRRRYAANALVILALAALLLLAARAMNARLRRKVLDAAGLQGVGRRPEVGGSSAAGGGFVEVGGMPDPARVLEATGAPLVAREPTSSLLQLQGVLESDRDLVGYARVATSSTRVTYIPFAHRTPTHAAFYDVQATYTPLHVLAGAGVRVSFFLRAPQPPTK